MCDDPCVLDWETTVINMRPIDTRTYYTKHKEVRLRYNVEYYSRLYVRDKNRLKIRNKKYLCNVCESKVKISDKNNHERTKEHLQKLLEVTS